MIFSPERAMEGLKIDILEDFTGSENFKFFSNYFSFLASYSFLGVCCYKKNHLNSDGKKKTKRQGKKLLKSNKNTNLNVTKLFFD